MSKLKLDLHDIYNRGDQIDRALREVLDEAARIKASQVEIIPGKGSGQLKKKSFALPRPKGNPPALPPIGKRLRQLRSHFCLLPLEVTGYFLSARARRGQDLLG